jgi:hypothetical protein
LARSASNTSLAAAALAALLRCVIRAIGTFGAITTCGATGTAAATAIGVTRDFLLFDSSITKGLVLFTPASEAASASFRGWGDGCATGEGALAKRDKGKNKSEPQGKLLAAADKLEAAADKLEAADELEADRPAALGRCERGAAS